MISQDRKFIFVHIPKTGGNSVQNILRDYSEDEIVTREAHQDGIERFEIHNRDFGFSKHSFLSDYKSRLPADVYAQMFKFACVRNPWERAISFYFSPHRGVSVFQRDEFIALLRSVPTMADALRADKDQPMSGVAANLDYLMRFERLQEDFDLVCDRLGIPRQALPRRNQSARGHVRDYYDEETVELVREVFFEDVQLFGYDVPWAGEPARV